MREVRDLLFLAFLRASGALGYLCVCPVEVLLLDRSVVHAGLLSVVLAHCCHAEPRECSLSQATHVLTAATPTAIAAEISTVARAGARKACACSLLQVAPASLAARAVADGLASLQEVTRRQLRLAPEEGARGLG